MSKIKHSSSSTGTGTYTIASGTSNSDFVLTLPDSTGTLATTADVPTSITDNADATAITIDSSEQVGIGTGSPTSPLHVLASSAGQTVAKFESNQAGALAVEIDADADRDSFFRFQEAGTTRWDFFAQGSSGTNELNIRNQSGTNLIQFKQDGRGLSDFTAKSWCLVSGTGTVTVLASHNVSSVTDQGTGQYKINFSNSMASSNYSVNFTPYGGKLMGRGSQDTSYTEVRNHNPDNGNYEDNSEFNALVFAS